MSSGKLAALKAKRTPEEKLRALKIEFNKLLKGNINLQQELETANNRADKNYGMYKEYERKFLEVSSYCACQKKVVGK